MMDYARKFWWPTALTPVKKLQVFQAKCLRIVNKVPWFIANGQFHENLEVSFFADHVRSPTKR
jgi:hypothetical protein